MPEQHVWTRSKLLQQLPGFRRFYIKVANGVSGGWIKISKKEIDTYLAPSVREEQAYSVTLDHERLVGHSIYIEPIKPE
jgi:hypothetical protein